MHTCAIGFNTKFHVTALRGKFQSIRKQVKQHDFKFIFIGVNILLFLFALKNIIDVVVLGQVIKAEKNFVGKLKQVNPNDFKDIIFTLGFPEKQQLIYQTQQTSRIAVNHIEVVLFLSGFFFMQNILNWVNNQG
ncbi:hypothetical protein D3C85_1055590 [compost metagenome]